MKSTAQNPNSLNVLLIGNNPMEMGTVLDKLKQVRAQKIITEIAFDLRSILERLMRFNPNFIFIDDNIGRSELQETLKQLSSNRKTKDVPITVLKSSNYHEALGASSVLDYLLKQNLSADALYNAVKNSFRLRRTQLYLYKLYQKRKRESSKKDDVV
jgi:DNA-binding NarL/FixJ family response regulator